MADVRSLLRSELASRNASTNQATSSRKRKAAEDFGRDRKKTKYNKPAKVTDEANASEQPQPTLNSNEPSGDLTAESNEGHTVKPKVRFAEAVEHKIVSPPIQAPLGDGEAIDEDEWAAFEAGITRPPDPPDTTSSSSTITAAPISAEELAARAREEESKPKRGKRDEEMEEEKEDARRALEQEFEEMDELEQRVKSLRERREALRSTTSDVYPTSNEVPELENDRDDKDDQGTVMNLDSEKGIGMHNISTGEETDDTRGEEEDDDDWTYWS